MTYYELIHEYNSLPNVEEEAIKFIIQEVNSITNMPLHIYDEANELTIKLVKEYVNGKAPQYLVGHTYFYGLKLNVNENVLIPRFDTEVVVDECIECCKKYNNPKVLDGFTGSGAIAIALKKNSDADVDAFDISEKALEVASKNASLNDVSVNFFLSDKFDSVNDKYDILVANPPYIEYGDTEVDKRVFDNEPHLALFADDEGLHFYKYIIDNYKLIMNHKFTIILEIPYNKAREISDYAKERNLSVTIKKDLGNRDRIMILEGCNE